MTKLEEQVWEQERAKGYNRFILRAILRVGLPFGVWMTLGAIFIPMVTHHPGYSVWELVGRFGFFTIGFGWGMGAMTWRRRERESENDTVEETGPPCVRCGKRTPAGSEICPRCGWTQPAYRYDRVA